MYPDINTTVTDGTNSRVYSSLIYYSGCVHCVAAFIPILVAKALHWDFAEPEVHGPRGDHTCPADVKVGTLWE